MPERAPSGAPSLQQESALPKHGLAEDYAALEATLRDTPLGRWFLAEYARRNRTPETQLLLDAIARLEVAVLRPRRQTTLASLIAELVAISDTIMRTRREIAELRPPHEFEQRIDGATEELGQIVEATEKATSEILSSAEDVQEIAWMLREQGVDPKLCGRLNQHAIDIYTACSFQDITGQRTGKVVQTLRHIEQRIDTMIGTWGSGDVAQKTGKMAAPAHTAEQIGGLVNGPATDGEGLKQDEIDAMLGQAADAEAQSRTELGRPVSGRGAKGSQFEQPDPLTFSQLQDAKRAALFG